MSKLYYVSRDILQNMSGFMEKANIGEIARDCHDLMRMNDTLYYKPAWDKLGMLISDTDFLNSILAGFITLDKKPADIFMEKHDIQKPIHKLKEAMEKHLEHLLRQAEKVIKRDGVLN